MWSGVRGSRGADRGGKLLSVNVSHIFETVPEAWPQSAGERIYRFFYDLMAGRSVNIAANACRVL